MSLHPDGAGRQAGYPYSGPYRDDWLAEVLGPPDSHGQPAALRRPGPGPHNIDLDPVFRHLGTDGTPPARDRLAEASDALRRELGDAERRLRRRHRKTVRRVAALEAEREQLRGVVGRLVRRVNQLTAHAKKFDGIAAQRAEPAKAVTPAAAPKARRAKAGRASP